MMAAMDQLGLGTAELLVAGVALAAPVSAGPSAAASGSFLEITGASTVTKAAGGNLFYSGSDTGLYPGGLSGTVSDAWTAVLHKDGSFQTKGTETCPVCTIGSRTGSFPADRSSPEPIFLGPGRMREGSSS